MTEYTSFRKNGINGLLTLLGAVFLLTAFACQTDGGDAVSSNRADDHVVFLVRHGEKCLGQGADPELTSAGTQRSVDLSRLLEEVPLDAIYSTPYRRTLATAKPTATKQQLEIIETPTSSTFLEDVAATLRSSGHSYSLVSGHSNTTPALVNLLAGTDLPDLEDDVYDRLFVVTLGGDSSARLLTLGYGSPSAALTECP